MRRTNCRSGALPCCAWCATALLRGWYLVRVTGHFLLLRSQGFGFARLHDNHHTGAALTARTHGRRKVTHVSRLLGGPLVETM